VGEEVGGEALDVRLLLRRGHHRRVAVHFLARLLLELALFLLYAPSLVARRKARRVILAAATSRAKAHVKVMRAGRRRDVRLDAIEAGRASSRLDLVPARTVGGPLLAVGGSAGLFVWTAWRHEAALLGTFQKDQ
jgi:hypothetical protein